MSHRRHDHVFRSVFFICWRKNGAAANPRPLTASTLRGNGLKKPQKVRLPAKSLLSRRLPVMFFDRIEDLFGPYVLRQFVQLGVFRGIDLHLFGHERYQCYYAGDLMLGQQADLQIEIRPLVGKCRHAILGNQDKCREEDRFHRSEHGQDDKGGVEGGKKRQPAQID